MEEARSRSVLERAETLGEEVRDRRADASSRRLLVLAYLHLELNNFNLPGKIRKLVDSSGGYCVRNEAGCYHSVYARFNGSKPVQDDLVCIFTIK